MTQLEVAYLLLYRSVNSLLYTFLLKFIDLLVVVKKIENWASYCLALWRKRKHHDAKGIRKRKQVWKRDTKRLKSTVVKYDTTDSVAFCFVMLGERILGSNWKSGCRLKNDTLRTSSAWKKIRDITCVSFMPTHSFIFLVLNSQQNGTQLWQSFLTGNHVSFLQFVIFWLRILISYPSYWSILSRI